MNDIVERLDKLADHPGIYKPISEMKCLAQGARDEIERLREALVEVEEYFDDRADADQPPGHPRPIPNEEMRMLMTVRAALGRED